MLLGRGEEQRAIDALLSAARLAEGGVLVVSGEPGIGKSALVGYAESQAQDFRLLRVTGTETERDLPFAGLAQLLRPLSKELDRLPEPQAEALGVALALRSGPRVDRFAVSAGVLNLLTRAGEDAPLGLIVDDGHLLDRPSAEAIVFTCRRLLADAVFVLVAARGEPGHVWSAGDLPQLAVTGLPPAEAAALAAAASPVPLGRALTDRVVELANGNPLAIRELVRDPDLLAGLAPHAPVLVPRVVADTFGRRAATLDPGDQTVMLVVAVADGDLPVIARACAVQGLDLRALERAELLGLLSSTANRVTFSHSLVRSAVYASASAAERRRVHGLIADALPAGDQDRRAWHRCASVLGVDAAIAGEIEEVGRRAAERGAHAVAASAYERAAHLSTTIAERGVRLLAAGEEAWFAGEDGRALPLLQEADRHDPSPAATARASRLEGLIIARGGSLREARDTLISAARTAETEAPEQALLMYADVVNICFYLLDLSGGMQAADRAEKLLAGRNDDEAAAIASIAIGMARIMAGERGAERIRYGVGHLVEQRQDVQSAWEVIAPLFLRDAGTGRELIAKAVTGSRAAAAIGTLPRLLHLLARDDATTHLWSRAAAGYAEAAALAREFGQTTELAASLAGLTWLTARQGKAAVARQMAAEALDIAEAHESQLLTAWVRFALAELALSMGEVDGAAAQFLDLETWLTQLGLGDVDLSPVPELVEARARAGRVQDVREVATAYLGRAEHKGQPWSLARAARVEGLFAEESAFEAHFDEALEQHSRTLDTFEEARTRLVYGERLRRSRRRVDARVQLQAALEAFERLGAHLWADMAVAELDATGVTAHRRGTGPVVDLTARELQIALLLSDGKTTREAAAALFVSPKTIEYHLRHVYTKLDIGSRSELTERMRDST